MAPIMNTSSPSSQSKQISSKTESEQRVWSNSGFGNDWGVYPSSANETPDVQVSNNQNEFEVTIHTGDDFKPEELKVYTYTAHGSDVLKVEGKHMEDGGGSYVSRQFSRSYTLPSDCKVFEMVSNLESGKLSIKIPKSQPQALMHSTNKREVPIQVNRTDSSISWDTSIRGDSNASRDCNIRGQPNVQRESSTTWQSNTREQSDIPWGSSIQSDASIPREHNIRVQSNVLRESNIPWQSSNQGESDISRGSSLHGEVPIPWEAKIRDQSNAQGKSNVHWESSTQGESNARGESNVREVKINKVNESMSDGSSTFGRRRPFFNDWMEPVQLFNQDLFFENVMDKAERKNDWSSFPMEKSAQEVETSETDGKFTFSIDIQGYEPKELKVSTLNDVLKIEGKHASDSEQNGHRKSMSKQFVRSYVLPRSVYNMNNVESCLTRAGKLVVTVPKLAPLSYDVREVNIPIKMPH